MNDCRLGRYKLKEYLIELLDNNKLVVFLNDQSPILNDCRLGRYQHEFHN